MALSHRKGSDIQDGNVMLLQTVLGMLLIAAAAEIAEHHDDQNFCLTEDNNLRNNVSLDIFQTESEQESEFLSLEWSHLMSLTGLFCGCYCRRLTWRQYLFEVLTRRVHCEDRERCVFIDDDNYVDIDGFGCSPIFDLITNIQEETEYDKREIPSRMGWKFTELTESFNHSSVKNEPRSASVEKISDSTVSNNNEVVDDDTVMPVGSFEPRISIFDMSLRSLLEYPMEAVGSFLQIILDGGD
ncbi:hypothetical protein RvY_13535 [Ramazzottius varieornatus]|uniref:Uncharacterized protein n=1 Tax=Ramazzottius varieornatus TaxID=947166 RepID=A0A1D1VS91_RAMVA|nr:hypothetical protein RvY_13535 [Ramazzottius varieornatus]